MIRIIIASVILGFAGHSVAATTQAQKDELRDVAVCNLIMTERFQHLYNTQQDTAEVIEQDEWFEARAIVLVQEMLDLSETKAYMNYKLGIRRHYKEQLENNEMGNTRMEMEIGGCEDMMKTGK